LAVRQNTSYYQQRAREDAHEQQFRAGGKKKEERVSGRNKRV
jgi:hypothetical protein